VTTQDSGIASIAVYDLKTGEMTRVSREPGEYTGLTWLPGDLLAFGGANGLGLVHIGASAPLSLLSSRVAQTPWSVTPDGQRLAYFERSSDTGFDLWTVPLHRRGNDVSAGRPEPFLRSAAFEVYPAFSPDGRWLAYASNESGRWEIYVRRFSNDATKIRVSAAGGVVPRWSPNGRELLYRTSEQHVMVVPYQLRGDTFVPGTASQWSTHVLTDTGVIPNFDVSATGNEILALMSVADAQSANHVTVILNVVDEIRRRTESR
jgi:serine/threonine-protein kinase